MAAECTLLINIGKEEIDLEKLDNAAHYVPSGTSVWEGRQERFDLTQLKCYRSLKDTRRLERSLGTLGDIEPQAPVHVATSL